MTDTQSYISENAIRARSYLIWKSEGCPEGSELAHWLQAKAELETEERAYPPLRKASAFVMPRLPISTPPCKRVSARLTLRRASAAANAARR
jgi:hypothetical protein